MCRSGLLQTPVHGHFCFFCPSHTPLPCFPPRLLRCNLPIFKCTDLNLDMSWVLCSRSQPTRWSLFPGQVQRDLEGEGQDVGRGDRSPDARCGARPSTVHCPSGQHFCPLLSSGGSSRWARSRARRAWCGFPWAATEFATSFPKCPALAFPSPLPPPHHHLYQSVCPHDFCFQPMRQFLHPPSSLLHSSCLHACMD